MGKKGKEKITGTPDVVKFKGERQFQYLRECISIQESLPFVASDLLDDLASKRVARFLNLVGLLAEFCQAENSKEYRFLLHHHLLEPVPQYHPFGYPAGIVKSARWVIENPAAVFNSQQHSFPEDLKASADHFLKEIDSTMVTRVVSFIEAALKDDFASGLKKFKADLRGLLEAFDAEWITFEKQFLETMFDAHNQVFVPIEECIRIESDLTEVEEALNIEEKQRLENELVVHVEEITNKLIPKSAEKKFPADVVPHAEAVLFYENKCSEEWQTAAKYVIRDYLKIRIYLTRIAEMRMCPEFVENQKFMRLLNNFHQSVIDALPALEFVSKLPKLIHAKTSNWLTRKLLEPELN